MELNVHLSTVVLSKTVTFLNYLVVFNLSVMLHFFFTMLVVSLKLPSLLYRVTGYVTKSSGLAHPLHESWCYTDHG